MSIASTEQWFIDLIKTRFEDRLRQVESLPADWDDSTFERALYIAPGVFVVFNGGPRLPEYGDALVIQASWTFIIATTHEQNELARRHGDSLEIGAYQILEILLGLLEGTMPPDAAGPLAVQTIGNLFSNSNERQGATLYAIEAVMPQGIADSAAEPVDPDLGNFVIFHGDIDLAQPDGQVDASDTVTLPQGAP